MEAYEILGFVGKGSFGTVSKVRRKADGKIFVWKEYHYGKMSEKEKQLLVSEVNILREFKHPNIVRYHDRIIDRSSTKIYIVMEYCEGGDVAGLIKKKRREGARMDENTIWTIFAQVVHALQVCHRRKDGVILHRDLKPANIFLDGNNLIKLGDFGLARVLGSESLFAFSNVGTPFYMSPEQINESAYNEKSDIWALGCLLYELAMLTPPFQASNQLALAVGIKSGRYGRISSSFSDDLHKTVQMCLQVEQWKRPDIDQVMKLPRVEKALSEFRGKLAAPSAGLTQKDAPTSHRHREEDLRRKEKELDRKEAELVERERRLDEREKDLARREKALMNDHRERRTSLENHTRPVDLGQRGKAVSDGNLLNAQNDHVAAERDKTRKILNDIKNQIIQEAEDRRGNVPAAQKVENANPKVTDFRARLTDMKNQILDNNPSNRDMWARRLTAQAGNNKANPTN